MQGKGGFVFAATPVPLSVIAVGDGSLSDSVIVAVLAPVAVGVKRTAIVHVCLKVSVRPEQESAVIAKSAPGRRRRGKPR